MREQFEIEYTIRSSPSILYGFLTTASGLAQWFSETCDINGSTYVFGWKDASQEAELISKEDEEKVRYKWVDGEENEFFEFAIEKSEVSNDTILIISDFADEDDVEDQILLWDSQIKILKQQIGG